jgi:hypothetical protein
VLRDDSRDVLDGVGEAPSTATSRTRSPTMRLEFAWYDKYQHKPYKPCDDPPDGLLLDWLCECPGALA